MPSIGELRDAVGKAWRQFFPPPAARYQKPATQSEPEPPAFFYRDKYGAVETDQPSPDYLLVIVREWPPHDQFLAAIVSADRHYGGAFIPGEQTASMPVPKAFAYADAKMAREGYSRVVYWEDPRMLYGPQ